MHNSITEFISLLLKFLLSITDKFSFTFHSQTSAFVKHHFDLLQLNSWIPCKLGKLAKNVHHFWLWLAYQKGHISVTAVDFDFSKGFALTHWIIYKTITSAIRKQLLSKYKMYNYFCTCSVKTIGIWLPIILSTFIDINVSKYRMPTMEWETKNKHIYLNK